MHIYGLSFSPVDEDYIDWIYQHTPKNARWEVSWYTEIDKERIDKFILEHWDVKDRLNLIELKDMMLSLRK